MRRAVVGVILAAVLVLAGALGAAASDYYRARDFYALWSGARLVAADIDPYDEVRWCAETDGVSIDAKTPSGEIVCKVRYAYPLWTAVLMLPYGVLSLAWAASLWLALTMAATLTAAMLAWRTFRGPARAAPLFLALVVGSQPFWLMVAGGQVSGLLALGIAGSAYLGTSGRESSSAASLALTALKPNVLGLAVLVDVLARVLARRTAFLVGGALTLVALFAVTLPFDAQWPREWLYELFGRQIGHAPDFATAWGIAAHDLGSLWWGPVLIAVVSGACLAIGRGIPRDREAQLALAVPLSLFATPYAWSYDYVPLVLSWAFVTSRAVRLPANGRRALLAAIVLVASAAPWVLYGLAFRRETETLSALVPAATAALVALACRLER